MAEISYAYIQVDSDGAVQNIAMFENYEDANRITRAVYKGPRVLQQNTAMW